MATTEHFYTGNNSTTSYAFTFPYYKTSDIKVTWDDALKTESTHYNVTGTNIVFTSGNTPGNNVAIHIYRETDVDTSKATFAAGSSIRAGDLNNNELQLLYHAQEQNFNTIQTADIQDGAITSAKILDGTIATADIATGAINADKIAADAVGASEIAANAVGASELANNAVDTDAILDDAVTSAKIGTGQVGPDNLANLAVTTAKLNNTSVTADKLASNSVITAKIDTGAVTAAKIGTDAVTTVKILDNNVTTAKIANDSVTADKLANSINTEIAANTAKSGNATHTGEVTGATSLTIADSAVVTDRIADNAVTTAKIPDNAVTTAKIADAELSTLAGMQSGTASLLASGTALTSTTAELNLLDGKSVVTAVSGSSTDVQLPTAKAVNDQILSITNALGGFVAIANETVFPNANPDPSDGAGTVVSIGDAGGLAINGSGVATVSNGNVANNATITINGFPSTLNDTNLSAGQGLQVQTTSTLHTYDYHKLIPNEAGVGNIQTAIDDFNNRYQVASSAPSTQADGTALEEGDLWYDQGNDEMKVYDNTLTAFKAISSTGNYSILDLRNAANNGSAVYDGSIKDYTLVTKGGTSAVNPNHAAQLIVSLNGVIQEPNTGTSTPTNGFALNGSTIKFSNNLPSGTAVFIAKIGATVDIGTPSSNTVTATILQNGSVIKAKIGADAVDGTKIEDDAVAAEHLASNAVVTASIVDDAVTADKLANSINTEIAANTAKVTNATHSGEVTGATALTIADDVVDEANLKVSNSPTNGQYLQAQSGNTGGLTWAAVSQYTTPLTTAGDILYRDGSGDQRLAKGTAGQALIMNSGATAPEWGAAGATIANDANNRVITADGSAGLNGEANLTFDGTSLTNAGNTISQGYESPATVAANWSIGANNNAMFPGPMTVADGVTVTVPASRTLTIV